MGDRCSELNGHLRGRVWSHLYVDAALAAHLVGTKILVKSKLHEIIPFTNYYRDHSCNVGHSFTGPGVCQWEVL